MKKKFFFLSMLAALVMTGCTQDDVTPNGGGEGETDANYSDNYLSVSIEMPTATGTRAEGQGDNDYDKYQNGTEEESNVTNCVFFFFDSYNNIVDIQKLDAPAFSANTTPNNNPYVSHIGIQEIRLKSGLNYSQVAVVLNSSAQSATSLVGEIKNLDNLLSRVQDYARQVETDGSRQVMSNSVFYNTNNHSTAPTKDKKYILVPITAENIYNSAEKGKIEELLQNGTKKYVEIYVERVSSKISVESNIKMDDYYTTNPGVQTITIYNNKDLTTKTVRIRPRILGMTLNVLTNEATLIKNITANELGYNNNDAKGFLWNDPINKRCYWATTPTYDDTEMTYYSFDETMEKGMDAITAYINPNTQDYTPGKEDKTKSTKVMVVAQLESYDENDKSYETPKNIDLVRYGGDYMESSNLLAQVASQISVSVRNINWDEQAEKYTKAEIEILKVAVNNSFAEPLNSDKFEIIASGEDSDKFDTYSAVISKTKDFDYEITVDKSLFDDYYLEDEEDNNEMKNTLDNEDLLQALFNKAKTTNITSTIDNALVELNKPNILYWKNGKTYFYTTIHHQGFYGLTGVDNSYLNGVVRNHIYKITLDGIYGLGTPVIDPGKPIDPERPNPERPSYLKARINILPWRVVTQSATIH